MQEGCETAQKGWFSLAGKEPAGDGVCVDGEGGQVEKGHLVQEAQVVEVCVVQVQGKMETMVDGVGGCCERNGWCEEKDEKLQETRDLVTQEVNDKVCALMRHTQGRSTEYPSMTQESSGSERLGSDEGTQAGPPLLR